MMRFAMIILMLGLAVLSCRKKSNVPVEQFCEEGFIVWRGDPSADGLGWVYVRNLGRTQPFALKGLPDAYKVDSLAVHICLEKTNEIFNCMCASPMNYYRVNSVERR